VQVEEIPIGLCEASQAEDPLETVFDILDGHYYLVNGVLRHVEVYGIYDEDGHRWVQLALDRDPRWMMTLRLRDEQDPDCLLISLTQPEAA